MVFRTYNATKLSILRISLNMQAFSPIKLPIQGMVNPKAVLDKVYYKNNSSQNGEFKLLPLHLNAEISIFITITH
jgi:hypothetical protein